MAENTIFSVEEVLQLEARVSAIETMINSLTQMLAVGGVNISVPELSSTVPNITGTATSNSNSVTNTKTAEEIRFGNVPQPVPAIISIIQAGMQEKQVSTPGQTLDPRLLQQKPQAKVPNLIGKNKNFIFSPSAQVDSNGLARQVVKADDPTNGYFYVTLVEVPSWDKYNEDIIVDQIPLGGGYLDAGSEITVKYNIFNSGMAKRMYLQ